eukprot:TRINITY_DN44851_c0_g1_i1.p1 TRINITY_DN44851_c0_g1~~TRINITY_DN44851_c0_g1_i1.p1  ORF type:complete len:242 (-),score=16.66 TRINITY_DN44851_c0_g1_i1:332-1057(-)
MDIMTKKKKKKKNKEKEEKKRSMKSLISLRRYHTCRIRTYVCQSRKRTQQPSIYKGARFQVVCGKGFGVQQQQTEKVDSSLPLWEQNRNICPCLSGKDYQDCCERYHGGEFEPTAEAVMRARYSAYVKKKVPYILRTTHSKNPSQKGTWFQGKQSSTLEEDIRATCNKLVFYSLEVLEVNESENEASVKFKIEFKVGGQKGYRQKGMKMQSMVENSKFEKEDGKWMYLKAIETDYTAHTYE